MAKVKISEFDIDPANNTDINNINIAEGCAPSGINNAIRQLMSDLKEFQTGAGGDPFNGAVNGTVGATTPASGAFTTLSASSAFSANGGATLGDASGDALTINSSAVSIPNGLNFGSNNLVLSSGNVGIGTSSPSAKLDVAGDVQISPSGTARSKWFSDGSLVYLTAESTIPFTIWTNGSERMRIDSSGNLGIGTSNPTNFGSAFKMLAVQGSDYGVIQAISNSGSTTLEMMGASGIGYVGTRTNHPIAFRTNDTERMRIDSSGNVGIGTSSPAFKLHVANLGGNSESVLAQYGSGTRALIGAYSNEVAIKAYNGTNDVMTFYTGASERMRIDSSGNLLLGTSSLFSGAGGKQSILWSPSAEQGIVLKASGTTFNGNPILFRNNADGTSGVIGQSQTTVSYGTSSDYRLKENIVPMTGALAKVQQLKPVTYKWKVDGSDGQGFIAHELQAIVPDCVIGEKDAVNEDGSIKSQSIDTSFLVATLTAAIQEQQAIIADLKARIETLENK